MRILSGASTVEIAVKLAPGEIWPGSDIFWQTNELRVLYLTDKRVEIFTQDYYAESQKIMLDFLQAID